MGAAQARASSPPRGRNRLQYRDRRLFEVAGSTTNVRAKVRKAIKRGGQIESVDQSGRTPLLHATMRGNLEMISELLRFGARTDHQDDGGFTPLMIAIGNDEFEAVRVLVEEAATDLNLPRQDGRTPLMYCIELSRTRIARYLITFEGCNVLAADRNGLTALDLAVQRGLTDLVAYIAGRIYLDDRKRQAPFNRALRTACISGQAEIARYLVEHCAADVLDASESDDLSALELAALYSRHDILSYFLSRVQLNNHIRRSDGFEFNQLIEDQLIQEIVNYAPEVGSLDLDDPEIDSFLSFENYDSYGTREIGTLLSEGQHAQRAARTA